ncbi:MAG: HEPN domain-containing protein [Planctomycetes bacterium]|nr:HEPN domain-containing protein [Planctomycetota bacterium]
MPPRAEIVREWVRKARNDLETARRVMVDTNAPILDTGCFHCQQTVEKLLKAFLLWRGVESPKVHTLGVLFDLVRQQDEAFETIRDACEWLTRFAVQVRYPHGRDPSPQKAREALAAAETAYEFVLERLPAEVHA